MPDVAALLGEVPFVVVGGTATALYMPARYTEDIDILVPARDAPAAERALRTAGARPVGMLTIGGIAWRLPDGTELDMLVSDEPWASEAVAQPERDPAGLPIIALPYLVLMKLTASRGVDIGDLSRMLGGADEAALAPVRRVIQRHLPDAVEDLESFIQIGRLEFAEPSIRIPLPSPASSAEAEVPPLAASGDVLVREHMRRGRVVREHMRRPRS